MDVPSLPELAQAWTTAKSVDPGARARDIADTLGVTEGLLAAARAGSSVRPLRPRSSEFADLLTALQGIGPVMTLTRNDAAVHETTGRMGEVATYGAVGQVTGEIDLRLFLRHWHAGYAMIDETPSGTRHSVQIFDPTGKVIIKIYATGDTDMNGWQKRLESFEEFTPTNPQFSLSNTAQPQPALSAKVSRDELRGRWQALDHSHDFHRMLKELSLGRQTAFELAGDDLACPVEIDVVERMLHASANEVLEIMCFVGNHGCMQIFSGAVSKIKTMGPWLNVLDPGFNLHLRTGLVTNVWAVRKPTKLRGTITLLELLDADGNLICQFFGARPPGAQERQAWRDVLDTAIGGTP